MNLLAFQEWVRSRWGLPHKQQISDVERGEPWAIRQFTIAGMGLGGEAGEAQEHVKKLIRDRRLDRDALALELGDVIHYATVIATLCGLKMEDILDRNVIKLEERDCERT